MRRSPVLASLLVLALSIISTTFTLLATTSKTWSTQAYYYDQNRSEGVPSDLGRGEIKPACVWQRSPFYRCGIPRIDENGTCEIPECTFYPPTGRNQTSCRSAAEFGVDWGSDDIVANGLLGGATECQEVHYAGNLQIAASALIVVGLCLALVLSFSTVVLGFAAPTPSTQHHQPMGTDKGSGVLTEETRTTDDSGKARKNKVPWVRSSGTPYIVAILLGCLYVGSLLQILAQLFGVLGLTVNATPSNTFEATNAGQVTGLSYFTVGLYGSWTIGKALSTYATIAWTSAVLCAAVATSVFRTPRFTKLL